MTVVYSSGTILLTATSDDTYSQLHKELNEALLCIVKCIFSLLVVITKSFMFFSARRDDDEHDDNYCPISSFPRTLTYTTQIPLN